jgi:hypothetical protein
LAAIALGGALAVGIGSAMSGWTSANAVRNAFGWLLIALAVLLAFWLIFVRTGIVPCSRSMGDEVPSSVCPYISNEY